MFPSYFSLTYFSMDFGIIVWNCQGANGNKFIRTIHCFVDQYKLKILVLLEPRISGIKANRVIKSLRFDCSHRIEVECFSGGIWLIWREVVAISIIRNDRQFIHLVVSAPNHNNFLFTAVYGSPNFRGRQTLWSNLRGLDIDNVVPWLVTGDFNAFLSRDEKKEGSIRGCMPCKKFNEWLRECAMFDLGFYGPKFTWHRGVVYERLDRAVGNEIWQDIFHDTYVLHLPKVG